MCTGGTMTEITSFRKKVLSIRKEVNALDWTPDKSVFIAKTANKYDYISIAKIKSTFAPLLEKAGLDMDMEVLWDSLRVLESTRGETHVILAVKWTLIDVDTGYSNSDVVLGESSDMGDKAVTKAQTYSLKSWLSCKFLLAEGDMPDITEQEDSGRQFVKKSPEEKVEMKSRVLEQGVAPSVSKPKAEPKAEEKATEPEVKKAEEKPKAEDKPAEAKPAGEKFKPLPAQAKAIENITKRWEEKAKAGEVSVEVYNQMSMACASISSAAEAVEFIKKYKGI